LESTIKIDFGVKKGYKGYNHKSEAKLLHYSLKIEIFLFTLFSTDEAFLNDTIKILSYFGIDFG